MKRLRFLPMVLILVAAACTGEKPPRAMPTAATAPRAPDTFRVRMETSRGAFLVEVHREWAPIGVDRFHQLVSSGYYDDNRFFRVLTGFVVQFGVSGDPAVSAAWERLPIPDDPVTHSNTRGSVVFATGGPDTRTTQLFVNLVDNSSLDGMGFAPFGTVIEGMAIVDSIHAGYGERPDQSEIAVRGNAYLEKYFPELDFIRSARMVGSVATPAARQDSARK